MSFGRGGAFLRLAPMACAGFFALTPATEAKTPAPYRVVLAVAWGTGAGSDAFRDDVSRSLSQALAAACFTGVAVTGRAAGAESPELVFDVVLSDAVDETRYDDSIAGALQPGEPTQELRRVSYFEVSVDATLAVRASGAIAYRRHLVAHVSRRPVYVGEDARATARAEAIDDIVRDLTRTMGCGGDKLLRKIRKVIGEPLPAPSEPR
jgi:hypothetical protein